MSKVIPLLTLLIAGPVFADSSGANASASGSVYQVSPQTNLFNESYLPTGTVGEAFSTCATSSLSVGVVGSHNDAFDNMHSDGQSLGISFNMPIDTSGVNARCEKQQNAITRITELKAQRMTLEEDARILTMCTNALREGVVLSWVQFPWAEKCRGIVQTAVLKHWEP